MVAFKIGDTIRYKKNTLSANQKLYGAAHYEMVIEDVLALPGGLVLLDVYCKTTGSTRYVNSKEAVKI